jgi:predicted Zn finger-like uncharacterized protein
MLTRCPHCQTVFRASAEQLQAAGGRVRCGRCHQVFDARENSTGDAAPAAGQRPPAPDPLSDLHIEALLRPGSDGPDDNAYHHLDDLELPAEPLLSPAKPRPRQAPVEPAPSPPPWGPTADELPLALQAPTRRERSVGSVAGWGLAAVLLLLLLAAQFGYQNRLRLHTDPVWRPWIETLCGVMACALPAERRPEAVELADHTVQSHPRVAGALLITATLRNTAPFAQPYPDVEVMMMDMEQRPVAGRRFRPAEYLTGRIGDAFPSKGEAHLLLEVQDPGPAAVSFEFNFR